MGKTVETAEAIPYATNGPGHNDAKNRDARQGAAAAALRLAGASYPEITEALAFVHVRDARAAVEAYLANRITDPESREQLRAEEGARLDRLLRSVWGKALNVDHAEHLPAVKVALSVIDRRIRLYGLDAPAEVVVHNPTMVEIEAWVSSITQTAASDLMALEASVVDDGPAD